MADGDSVRRVLDCAPRGAGAPRGDASTCGCAVRFAVTSESPITTAAISGAPRSSRAPLSPTISAMAAAAKDLWRERGEREQRDRYRDNQGAAVN